MIDICPRPDAWAAIHQRLLCAVRETPEIPPPPSPLILAGWGYGNDVEKRDRWTATVEWAKQHGFGALVSALPPGSMYSVENPSSYQVGPIGGPMHLPWRSYPSPKVARMDREAAVAGLRTNWVDIVGGELGLITEPLSLTGAKGRRLLVRVKSQVRPPWGTWTTLEEDDRRREFTRFRAAVNVAIVPLQVDHVDFLVDASDRSENPK